MVLFDQRSVQFFRSLLSLSARPLVSVPHDRWYVDAGAPLFSASAIELADHSNGSSGMGRLPSRTSLRRSITSLYMQDEDSIDPVLRTGSPSVLDTPAGRLLPPYNGLRTLTQWT